VSAAPDSRVLYDRRVVLVVGKAQQQPKADFVEALRIEGLRVTFKVEKTDKPEPNKSEMAIYNLSAESRAALEGKDTPVLLMAGYASGVSQCFSGTARIVDSEKAGVDWVTRIRCGDWERPYCTAQVSNSFKAGTTAREIVTYAAGQLVKDKGNLEQVYTDVTRKLSSGFAASGNAAAELTRQLEADGFEWSIQDGRLQVLKPTGFTSDVGPLFTPDSGLIGTPALGTPEKKDGPQVWKVKVLLEPRLRPGQRFSVERTTSTDGKPVKRETFRARRVQHVGDTHGGDFFSEIEAFQA
jgi:hypothetical protein